jgi:glycerol-3-phosphate acyltransferase PlsY
VTVVAWLIGYSIGTIPTAAWLARARGIDLRQGGSGNPGANNARQLGGMSLAAAVLFVEMGKGAAAVIAGNALAEEAGAIVAGLGAIAGNVYNVWYRFKGGKGLGIAAGVMLALWPVGLLVLLATIAGGAMLTRSSGKATLIALAMAIAASVAWWMWEWDNAWGAPARLLPALALGTVAMIFPKHLTDARRMPRRHPSRGSSRP